MSDSSEGKKYRFYVPDLGGVGPGSVSLPADQAHHARGVLRVQSGLAVELFDGDGNVAHGLIAEVARSKVSVEIERTRRQARPEPIVRLAFAIAKGKRLDWLLEKATELGAASLQPVDFERSIAGTGGLS